MKESGKLSPDQERIVDRYLVEYRHQGYELSEKKYTELNTNWMKRLREANSNYQFRIGVCIIECRLSIFLFDCHFLLSP